MEMRKKPYQRLLAFIDWNSRLVAYKSSNEKNIVEASSHALKTTAKEIARIISFNYPETKFLVDIRLYHGWHKGFRPTGHRRAAELAIQNIDFSKVSSRQNVAYSGKVEYGDRLLVAQDSRLHHTLSIHLPNTVRSQDKRRPDVEKMVDTALATDLLTTSFQDPETWVLVVTEDDDLVPPLYAADLVLSHFGSRALLIRTRTRNGPFLKLDGIICEAT
ncbi:hypothetical protein JWH11_07855 [Xanthomonas melonis]|uniref:NYN domain-containing protein n=1 Tax=Xanthomonas melonis TaxID=56456 RepID=A0ABS8NTH5_9XANT|nr:hypothetical protein [Xanthomonas melonis]MCD0258140.1 hypothetical protein [Xanthomonas melonis]MCD0266360.1 hypothetical protein [Xanthomonas melonis]